MKPGHIVLTKGRKKLRAFFFWRAVESSFSSLRRSSWRSDGSLLI